MPRRSSRTKIEVRVAPDVLTLVKRAAEIQGRSLGEFVVVAAHAAAQRTIDEAYLIRLSVEDQARFAALLLDPPEPSESSEARP